MLQKSQPISIKEFNKGLFTFSNFLQNEKGHSPNCMNIKWNFDNSIQKRLGSITTNTVQMGSNSTPGWIVDSSNSLLTNFLYYWKLNEVSGTRVSSYNDFDLTPTKDIDYAAGIRGNAMKVDSAASGALLTMEAVYHAHSSSISGSGNFSVAGWFYFNNTKSGTTRTRVIAGKAQAHPQRVALYCGFNSEGSATLAVDESAYEAAMTFYGGASISQLITKFGNASLFCDGAGDYVSAGYANPTLGPIDGLGFESFTAKGFFRFRSTTGTQYFFDIYQSGLNGVGLSMRYTSNLFQVICAASTIVSTAWTPATGSFYHVLVSRDTSSNIRIFIDGAQLGSTVNYSGGNGDFDGGAIYIGADKNGASTFNGWIDDVLVAGEGAEYTEDFAVPTSSSGIRQLEYQVGVNSVNKLEFKVSTTGTGWRQIVTADSFGTLAHSTWYNFIAWHSNGTHIGVAVNLSVNTAAHTTSVYTGASSPLCLGNLSDNTLYQFDGRIDEVGFWNKVLNANDITNIYAGGSGNTYDGTSSNFTWAQYDFGASGTRWVTVAAGTGIYASSNLGVTFVEVSTGRTQTYQFFERSKNVLIACSDAYDQTMYWAGSVGTFFTALAVNSAPKAKFAQNHQGFLILLNSTDSNGTINKRRFHYVDESLQLTESWEDYFDLPSTADDETTGSFILNRTLYVSTKYRIYRVSYLGGNPDWSYEVVAYWGYVPRTIQRTSLEGGEVAIGLDWSRRIRIFDGSKDTIISDNIEDNNTLCEFAIKKISYAGSGLIVSNSVIDPIEQEYRLNVSIGENSSQTTHAIVLNLRSLAMYPYSNQGYQTMCIAESAGRQYLLAGDRSGRLHILNTGNLDIASAIDDVYESPFIFSKVPGVVQKSNKIDLYFQKNSAGTVYYQDRADFNIAWNNKSKPIDITNDSTIIHKIHSEDIPSTHNIYQFKIMSSSSTANPWRLTHIDFFLQTMGIGKGQ